MASLEQGTRIADWIVDAALDEGGMGSVYRCHNALSERILAALKVMDRHRADVSRDRFIREVEALASLRHEAVVRILGFGEAPEHRAFYIAMELVQGDSLARRIADGPWPWPGPREVFLKLAGGLAHAHARGIAHRDIKPQNLMYGVDGSACIIDFGISAAEGRTSLTSEGMFLGTVTHMAPELFGQSHVDPMRADLYALGQVFYEVLTGARAFTAQSALTAEQRMVYVMAAKMNSEPLDPGPSCPPALRALIREATHPDPLQRTPDLGRFLRALEAVPPEPGVEPPELVPQERAPLAPTEVMRSNPGSPAPDLSAPPPPVVPSTGSGRRPDLGIPTRSGRKPILAEPIAIPEPAAPPPEPEPEPEPEPARPALSARDRQRQSVLRGLGVGLLVGIPLALSLVGWQLGWFSGDQPPPPEPDLPPVEQAPTTPTEQSPATPDEPPSAPAEKPAQEATKATTPTESAPTTSKRTRAETSKDTKPVEAAPVAADVPMRLEYGFSLEGDLYSRALSPLFEGRRSAFESCFAGAGVDGQRTEVRVQWTLNAGTITAGPTASGGPDAIGRCLAGNIKRISFDSMQTGTVTLDFEYVPQR